MQTISLLLDEMKNKEDKDENYSPSFAEVNKVRTHRFKRRQLAVKFDESEARFPISFQGFAKYRYESGHMVERKRSWGSRKIKGDKWDTEPITVYKKNIGNYTLKGWT
jgi:hypothetical protein